MSHVVVRGVIISSAGSLRGKVGESILVAKVQRNLASVVGRIYIGTTAKKCLQKFNNEFVNAIVCRVLHCIHLAHVLVAVLRGYDKKCISRRVSNIHRASSLKRRNNLYIRIKMKQNMHEKEEHECNCYTSFRRP